MHLTVNMIYKQDLTSEQDISGNWGANWIDHQRGGVLHLAGVTAGARKLLWCSPLRPNRTGCLFSFSLSLYSCLFFYWFICFSALMSLFQMNRCWVSQLSSTHFSLTLSHRESAHSKSCNTTYILDYSSFLSWVYFSTWGVLGPRNQQKERKMFFPPKIVKTVKCFLV